MSDTDSGPAAPVSRPALLRFGRVRDAALIPVTARLAQSVEGVVGVDCRLEAVASR
ncbi:hypothetical protein [Streptomyces sp. NPDC002785]|uniref:hypothetical protein n=1 Tax=Streptomyces sp. NPDC002785 TaxID=3154543 RepID=UPI00331ADA03